jgi:hypothetical protein
LTIKHGDKLKLKSRHSFVDRFTFVGALQVAFFRKRGFKFVFLVHDAKYDGMVSCNISDIVGLTGRGELKDIDRLVKQLGQAIAKEKDLCMIERYEVSRQPAMNNGSISSASPVIDMVSETRKRKGNLTASARNAKKPRLPKNNANEKKKFVTKNEDDTFLVSGVALHLL